jgi:RimJ/RimL family protein N-acetyltransferase
MTHTAWHGDLVTLRDVEPDDWEAFHGFDQDTEAARLSWEIHFPRSKEGAKAWAEEKAKGKAEDDNHFFAILDPEGTVVGTINVHGTDPATAPSSTALRSIAGAGVRVTGPTPCVSLPLLLRRARIPPGGRRGVRLQRALHLVARAVRFRARRLHPRGHYTGGKRHDIVIYGMTAPEFRSRYG